MATVITWPTTISNVDFPKRTCTITATRTVTVDDEVTEQVPVTVRSADMETSEKRALIPGIIRAKYDKIVTDGVNDQVVKNYESLIKNALEGTE